MHAASRPILVVEDDPDIREMLATMLELQGHSVVTATNGAEAYNMARQHHPALILLDLMMPVMGGVAFRRAQVANASIAAVPVVVFSAHHEAASIAKRLNVAGCLKNPVDFDELVLIVERAIRHSS